MTSEYAVFEGKQRGVRKGFTGTERSSIAARVRGEHGFSGRWSFPSEACMRLVKTARH